jgi:phosphate transport system substrate-binding protein
MTALTRGNSWRLLLMALLLALVASACADQSGAGPGGGTDGEGLSGEVVVSGSSTVEPISVAVGEKFIAENPGVDVRVDGPGTSDGFELFCNGETDISDASRAIEQEEIETCEENGIEFIELKVAIDGLSVITSTTNDQVECLDFYDLYSLLGIEAEGFESWSDANDLAAEVGAAHAPYPDAPLVVTAPGEESGTYDSFAEIVLEEIAYEERKIEEDSPVIRPDYQASANDNVIIEGISGTDTSLGWVGYAFAQGATDTIKMLPIAEKGDDCVEPTPETISSGEYPIARDLFIYVKTDSAERPELQAYVDLYLSEEGIASVGEVGYVDLAEEDLEETRQVWESQETGTRES